MKQQDKNLIVTSAGRGTRATVRQRVLGIVALGGLFACGLMLGISVRGNMTRSGDVAPAQSSENTADMRTCEVIEMMQIKRLLDETDLNPAAHNYNIAIYQNLIENGCPENKEKYQGLIEREKEIMNSLEDAEDKRPCEVVENSLDWHIQNCDGDHIQCAKIYAQLAERGCPENAKKYTELAARELEIARGISDDKMSNSETVEVVETYKRLQMKTAAQDVINKVQKITDPAIDFILELEKIVNE